MTKAFEHPAGGRQSQRGCAAFRCTRMKTSQIASQRRGRASKRKHLEIRQMHGSSNFSQTTFRHLRSSDLVKSSACAR